MSWEYVNVNPNDTVCPMCSPFVGIVFESRDDGPPLPAHFGCFCSYMMTDAEPTFAGFDWDVYPVTKRRWIQELARRIRDGEVPPVPAFLLELYDAAVQYNEDEYKPREVAMSVDEQLDERVTLDVGHIRLEQSLGPRRYRVNFITGGKNANGWIMPLDVLSKRLSMFNSVPCLLNHSDLWAGADIQQWAATHEDPVLSEEGVDTTLRINDTKAGDELSRIFDGWLADKEAGLPVPPIGISADMSLRWKPRDDWDAPRECADIRKVWSGDAVLFPAAGGEVERVLNSIRRDGGITVSEKDKIDTDAVELEHVPVEAYNVLSDDIDALRGDVASLTKSVSSLASVVNRQLEDDTVVDNGPENSRLYGGVDGLEAVRSAVEWCAGVSGVPLPDPYLRRLDNIYQLCSGDDEWRGTFRPERVHLASANSLTLAGLVADAMNKVMVAKYDTLMTYRWFELVVSVQPNDGTLNDMKWIKYGGIGALPVVPYGSEYDELEMDDSEETDSFAVRGGYVGITRKVMRNSDIMRFQAIPRSLIVASVRARSAAIAGIFTANSGVGPTLEEDSKALFHADHSNLATTAYSTAGWKAARLECYKQTELNSDKRMGLWPAFWLGPGDLYDAALVDFGYGAGAGGYPGTSDNDVNPYAQSRPGDPRPMPISVPEFTDVNNWAYLVDPALNPVIMMSYSNNIAGTTHPMPDLYTVTSPLAGLMFSNDVMPIKVRDEYAYGVADYRGIGKRNVS